MDCIIGFAELEAIVNSLKSSISRREPSIAESCLTKAVKNGFANDSDIEDIFYYSDDRLSAIRYVISAERWCKIFSIPRRDYYSRPRRKQSSAFGSDGVSAEDLADLLINMEQIGYSIDPLSLVTKLSSKLADRAFVTNAELNILWYEKTRHKIACISFMVESDEMGRGWRQEKFKTRNRIQSRGYLEQGYQTNPVDCQSPQVSFETCSQID